MKVRALSGEIRAGLTVFNPPPSLKTALLELFEFSNPAYAQALKYSPWGKVGANFPKTIHLAADLGKSVWVPRGIVADELPQRLRPVWNSIKWRDKRHTLPVEFPQWKIAFNHEQRFLLKGFEKLSLNGGMPFGNVLCVAPTAVGKTIYLAAASKMTGQRTLVLCLTELIKTSWYDDLYKLYGLSQRDIGLIQRSSFKIGE
mgnify:FL=1